MKNYHEAMAKITSSEQRIILNTLYHAGQDGVRSDKLVEATGLSKVQINAAVAYLRMRWGVVITSENRDGKSKGVTRVLESISLERQESYVRKTSIANNKVRVRDRQRIDNSDFGRVFKLMGSL